MGSQTPVTTGGFELRTFYINTPAGIYLFKLSNGNTKKLWKIYSGVFIVNFEQISHIILVFSLLILNKQMPTETVP